MDSLGDSLSTSGLFLFRENYYPKKPNLSKIFSYGYILSALILIVLYCSPINGLRCSKQSYVAACETNVITSDQCNNLLIVDCELDCVQKGLSVGMTCDYQECSSGNNNPTCWQQSSGGGGGGGGGSPPPPPPGVKSCGDDCKYGKTGYYISTVSSVTGPSTCQNYLNLKKSIDKDQTYAQLRSTLSGQYPAKLKACCGILKEAVVCLSPSAVIGVVGGYLGILLSLFQVLFLLVSKFKHEDVFKKRMGHLVLTDPFRGYKKVGLKSTDHDNHEQHHVTNVEHIELTEIYQEPKSV